MNRFDYEDDLQEGTQHMLVVARQDPAYPRVAETLHYHSRFEKPALGLRMLQDAATIFRAYGDSDGQIRVLFDITRYYRNELPDVESAITYAAEALTLAEHYQLPRLSVAHRLLCTLHIDANEDERAMYHAEAGLRVAEACEYHAEMQYARDNMVSLLRKQNRIAETVPFLQQTLTAIHNGTYPNPGYQPVHVKFATMLKLADAYLQLQDWYGARHMCFDVLQQVRELRDLERTNTGRAQTWNLAGALRRIAETYWQTGDTWSAMAYSAWGVQVCRDGERGALSIVPMLWRIAEYYRQQGYVDAELDCHVEMLTALDNLTGYPDEDYQQFIEQYKPHIHAGIAAIHIQRGNMLAAIAHFEQGIEAADACNMVETAAELRYNFARHLHERILNTSAAIEQLTICVHTASEHDLANLPIYKAYLATVQGV